MNKIQSIFKKKCPKCRKGDLFTQPFNWKQPLAMPDNCPVCGQKYEPEPGFYYGAMFLSYIGTAFLHLFIAGFQIIVLDISVNIAFLVLLVFVVLTYFETARLSRSLWINLMVKYNPIDQHGKSLMIIFLVSLSLFANGQANTLSADDFEKGIKQKEIQILDVRTIEEYNSGHISDALQANWNDKEEFSARIKALDKAKPVYVYCFGGGRSNAAMNFLNENGFATINNLKGGISGWQQANKPLLQEEVPAEQMTMQDYLNLIPKDKTVLVDVGAEWCPPCRKMKPILADLEAKGYTIIKIKGEIQTQLCKELNITSFPVFIVYKKGVEVERIQGAVEFSVLENAFGK